MTAHKYLTAPLASTRMPAGIPYIVGNEAAERFSFYGMRGILVVFMTQYLLGRDGLADHMSEASAKENFHWFVMAVYFFPLLGALLSDSLLGKYRTIISLSIVYCLGHLALALDETRLGLFLGCGLIAVGSGGIKPCVSAHVGDQFGAGNQHLLAKVFGWFYFAVNFGAFISTLLTPLLLKWRGPRLAFGVPGVLMLFATVFFWLGRNKFVHIPPGGRRFWSETFSAEGMRSVVKLLAIFMFLPIFWSLFDQTGSAWVLQAEHMDRHWLGIEWESSQVQAINPILILLFIPLFSYVIYPTVGRAFALTPLRKIGIGLFLTSLAFIVSAWIEAMIQANLTPTIAWQLLAYAILTAAEVMVSITCLEFSYTQAPRKMKSIIMALYYLSVSLGNAFTAAVNWFIQNNDGTSKLAGPQYYYFFAGMMAGTALLFVVVALSYREQTYIQEETPAAH